MLLLSVTGTQLSKPWAPVRPEMMLARAGDYKSGGPSTLHSHCDLGQATSILLGKGRLSNYTVIKTDCQTVKLMTKKKKKSAFMGLVKQELN